MADSSYYTTNTFYLTFKDANPSWSLISCALTLGTIAAIGIALNVSVIFVSIQSKSLHGTVNYLLTLYSFFEVFHQFGHFLFVYTALSGQKFIVYNLAAKIQFIAAFGIGGTFPTMFFTGIDRLIGIIFTEIHDKIKKQLYLAVITLICTIYIIVGIVVRIKTYGLPSADSLNQRTFRSLFCIIAVNIGGYFILLFYVLLIKPAISCPITSWFGQQITAIPLNIGAASNGPILYFTSTEYRHAFHAQFPFILKQLSRTNRTTPQQNIQNM
ncbi:hypothetical protein niasHS_003119 [Heterodera schachtii]|uniref:G_PROTEIN_RECEP_F1_2 domain-containing protein n=1 Tax=Heterodera schachtii TaxID=97005 RepID=A0ABD2KA83_HETSC